MPCYWFLNYLILVLKQRKIVFWTTWDNSPNYLHWVNKCLQFDCWNAWDNSQIYLHWHTKYLGFDLKTTCYSFLQHHIFILEALQTYFRNIAELFWKHRRIILEIRRNGFRTTDNNIPNFCFLFIINPLFTHQKSTYRLVIHQCFIIGIMINKNPKEGVLRLKWIWVELYKNVFRNRKGYLQK